MVMFKTSMAAVLALAALTMSAPAMAQVKTGGGNCGNPAKGMIEAPQRMGGYWGQKLPGSFKHLRSQRQVDRAITRMSRTDAWPCFQLFYGGAVKKWKENTRRR